MDSNNNLSVKRSLFLTMDKASPLSGEALSIFTIYRQRRILLFILIVRKRGIVAVQRNYAVVIGEFLGNELTDGCFQI